jgi:hypothetical protein
MGLLIVGALAFALWASLRHGHEDRRKSRESRLKEIAKRMPGGVAPKAARRRNAVIHDSAWWAREAAHGFPVHRTGWHAGWLVHQTEALQQQAIRDQARETHENVRQSFTDARDKRRKALDQVEYILDAPDAPKGAVREAVADVLPFPGRRQPEVPEPGPYAPKDDPAGHLKAPAADPQLNDAQRQRDLNGQRNICAADGRPGTAGDPLVIADGYRVHQSDVSDPASGFYQASAHPAQPPDTRGDAMPTGTQSETTYSQTNTALDKIVSESEAEIARLRMRQVGQMVEGVASAGVGGSVLGHLADIDDGVQKQIAAAQQQLDSAQAAKAAHIRDHGQGHEYHSSAAGGGAEKSYLQE